METDKPVTPLRQARLDLFPGLTIEDVARLFQEHMKTRGRSACGGTSIARYERGDSIKNGAALNMLLDLAEFYFATAKGRKLRCQKYAPSVLCPDLAGVK